MFGFILGPVPKESIQSNQSTAGLKRVAVDSAKHPFTFAPIHTNVWERLAEHVWAIILFHALHVPMRFWTNRPLSSQMDKQTFHATKMTIFKFTHVLSIVATTSSPKAFARTRFAGAKFKRQIVCIRNA